MGFIDDVTLPALVFSAHRGEQQERVSMVYDPAMTDAPMGKRYSQVAAESYGGIGDRGLWN